MEKELRSNSVSRVGTKSTKLLLGKGDVEITFVRLGNRRDVRPSVVLDLKQVLERGEHFDTPLMANLKKERFRLLDGNHRIDAIEQYLEAHPDRKVEVEINYYEDLGEDEERTAYTKWNLGTKQNVNDFVKQYWKTMPLTKLFEKANLPWGVSPKWAKDSIEFRVLVGAYMGKDFPFRGGYSGKPQEFITAAQRLGEKAFNSLKAFMADYTLVFGMPDKANMHYKPVVFWSMQRIWLDNKDSKSVTDMQKAFKRVSGSRIVVEYAKLMGNTENCTVCRTMLLDLINGQRTNNLFV